MLTFFDTCKLISNFECTEAIKELYIKKNFHTKRRCDIKTYSFVNSIQNSCALLFNVQLIINIFVNI